MLTRTKLFAALIAAAAVVSVTSGQKKRAARLPVIDMHIHAELLSEFGDGKLSVC
jgi:hypothetical protein